jgi:biopolymer transport protein ExbB/TolQ
LWGVAASVGFYSLVYAGVLKGEWVDQWFAGHPVEYAATAMFFIGMAVLTIKAWAVVGQQAGMSQSLLGARFEPGNVVDDCNTLLNRLQTLPSRRQNDLLACRLRETLEHVRRQGSAETLDDQLKYLSDLDAARQHSSYAIVRVIIWAIPILGFLGTVLGLTMAIANLSPTHMEESMPGVIHGLSIAFGTTVQGLVLSIILMFVQYYVDRREAALLARVDERAAVELDARFEHVAPGPDGHVVAVRRMSETMVAATERLVQRQAELWQASLEAVNRRAAQLAGAAGKQLQESLGAALRASLKDHALQLAAAEEAALQRSRQHWQEAQQTETQNAERMDALQRAMIGQSEVLTRAIEATAEVTRLENSLNRNLAALAGSKNFEQTVMSLAAAIHLLNARLNDAPGSAIIHLDTRGKSTQAA